MTFPRLTAAAQTDQGVRRHNNEDAVLSLPDKGIFAVADGMGGAADGELASRAAVDAIDEAFSGRHEVSADGFEAVRLLIREATLNANDWILRNAEERGTSGSGATVVVMAFDPDDPARASVFHAGDSRAYRFRRDSLQLLTTDHSLVAEAGMSDDNQFTPMFRALVTRAVGVRRDLELEETPVDVEDGDLYLLCSDGLTSMLPDAAIVNILRANRGTSPDTVAGLLIDMANYEGGADNISVVLVRVDRPTEPEDNGLWQEIAFSREGGEAGRTATAVDVALDTKPEQAAEKQEPQDDAPSAAPTAAGPAGIERGDGHAAGAPRRSIARMAAVAVLTAAVALSLFCAWPWLRVHLGSDAAPVAGPLEEPQVPTSPLQDNGDESGELSAARIAQMRASLPIMIDGTLETGQWGRMAEHVGRWSAPIANYLESSGRSAVYAAWVAQWRLFKEGRADPTTSCKALIDAVDTVCRGAGLPAVPLSAQVPWPADAAARADAACGLLYRTQHHLLVNMGQLVEQLKGETGATGAEPAATLTDLWFFLDDKSAADKAAYIANRGIATNDLHKLAAWADSWGNSPIPAAAVKMVPGRYAARAVSSCAAARTILHRRLLRLPAAVETWRHVDNPDLRQKLDEIRILYRAVTGGATAPAETIWREKDNDAHLRALLVAVRDAVRIARGDRAPGAGVPRIR